MNQTVRSNIMRQPDAFARLTAAHDARTVADSLGQRAIRKVWFAGSGTSLYAGALAAGVWEQLTTLDAEAVSSLELVNDVPSYLLGADAVVVAISQSGGTKVLADGIQRARASGAATIAVTANHSSLLASSADAVVDSLSGDEMVFAKTVGFTTTALAAGLLGVAVARSTGSLDTATESAVEQSLDGLPGYAHSVITAADEGLGQVVERLRSAGSLFVVGSGANVAAAAEGALKILEIAKVPVIARELEESLHGYFNCLGPDSGIVLLAGDLYQKEKITAFCHGVSSIGAPLAIVAAESLVGPVFAPGEADVTVPHVPFEAFSPLIGVIPLQMLAVALAEARGVDPNNTRYPHLYQVFRTKTEHS